MRKNKLSREQKWKKLVSGQDRTWRRYLIWPLLLAAGKIYGAVIKLRNRLYEKGYKKRYWPGCHVISVGNITVGGTGKTPVVAMLSRALSKGGRKVAIVSRGYKSHSPSLRFRLKHKEFSNKTKVVCDGKELLLSPKIAGDEPYMLAQELKNVIVVTDPDRVRGARYAIREFGVDTIILDDGMQHMRLRRQNDIVLIDANCPFGYGRILPAGLLREPLEGLKRADHIFITKAENLTEEKYQELVDEIRLYNQEADILTCQYEPEKLVSVHTEKESPVSLLKDLPIMVVTGIAQPDGFVKILEKQGANVVCKRFFPDHHRFRRYEIEEIYETAKNFGAQAVLVTEKDAVRFSKHAGLEMSPPPVYYLKVALAIKKGEENFVHMVEEICSR
ncbi:tetraacyldisaccharide 4'-kinase [bacterium]|nr:tetraacyldisaccharide 4'-kinase [bacterium]